MFLELQITGENTNTFIVVSLSYTDKLNFMQTALFLLRINSSLGVLT